MALSCSRKKVPKEARPSDRSFRNAEAYALWSKLIPLKNKGIQRFQYFYFLEIYLEHVLMCF